MPDIRWSQYVQSTGLMETSRRARFTPRITARLIDMFSLRGAGRVLEVGCGVGILTRALAASCPDTSFVGLDRDADFITAATRSAANEGLNNVQFIVGDALHLPFGEEAFDYALSYTLMEHLPPVPFLSEQKRVLRPGGTVAALSMFPQSALHSVPDNIPGPSAREQELLALVKSVIASLNVDADIGVAKWALKPYEMPGAFEEAGLQEVRVDAMAIPECVGKYNEESLRVLAMLTAYPREQVRIAMALEQRHAKQNPGYASLVTKAVQEELLSLVDERMKQRIEMRTGAAPWEVHVGMMLAVIGRT